MSRDFPNRADWLARRETPVKLPAGRMIHVSAPLVTVIDPVSGNPRTIIGRGITLNVGSNARKRKRAAVNSRSARKAARQVQRDADWDRRMDALLYANEDFDVMKREQEVDA